MSSLSKKRRSKDRKLAFIDYICEMSRRTDIDAIENSLKSYWKDKKENPWNKVYSILKKYWEKERPDQDISDTLLLIRDGLFGALDIHSMSLSLDISTNELLRILLRGKSWNEGRRKVRTYCSELVSEMIENRDTKHLVPSGLERDGFGFLVPSLRAARIEQFKKARPRKRKGKLYLKGLANSMLGRNLLRLHMITPEETTKGKQRWTLSTDDPRADELLEAYENMILDLEIDEKSRVIPDHTLQVTLNGKPLSEKVSQRKEYRSFSSAPGIQEPLTDYLAEKQKEQKIAKEPTKKKKAKKEPEIKHDLSDIDGVGPSLKKKLKKAGIKTVAQLSETKIEELASKVDGIGEASAKKFIAMAEKLVAKYEKTKTSKKKKRKSKKRKTKKKRKSKEKGGS